MSDDEPNGNERLIAVAAFADAMGHAMAIQQHQKVREWQLRVHMADTMDSLARFQQPRPLTCH